MVMEEYSSVSAPVCCRDPINPNDVQDLLRWCRGYAKSAVPVAAFTRYAIGIYQIGQMLEWSKRPSGRPAVYQNAAAGVIHILGAGELRGIKTWCLPDRFSEIPRGPLDIPCLLIDILKGVQIHFYMRGPESRHVNLRARSSRYTRVDLRQVSVRVINQMVGQVPVDEWCTAVENEVQILLGKG